MKMKKYAIFLFIIFCNTSFSQDLVSGGSNNWLFHTPDDGRTTLWIAPFITDGYQFGQSTSFLNNGDVIFSNNLSIGKTPSSYQHGGVNKVVEVYNQGTSINSQSHVILSSGSTLPNSSVGSVTWSMPNITASNKGLAYFGVITGNNSTSSNPSSSMVFATRNASQTNWTPQMILSDNGFLGIGTLYPKNPLDVKGTIHSQEVKVDMLNWSDFVFKKEYKLPTLEEVENQIIRKGHLENIPSEEEVVKNGIYLGEMNAKLLQKIEELTLYLIQQNKEIEKQNKETEELRQEMKSMKSQIKK